MKRVFVTADSAELGLLQSRLEDAGIPCEARNEILSIAMPGAPFHPELWVRDEDFEEALALIQEWRSCTGDEESGE